ncbi:MAG TPA: tRNA (adenosine(37)-N6)-dimethylallyltransferase MiaA [Candidatus Acidoferrales bacterium]|nr:tRNA (adenosine(37)-N6)-dimethylallyltransferase MiaA [Candidatus Acidoferrales bacterium]
MTAVERLVVILGPTATGKSALATHLAQRLGGEILACDSTQIYRRFDIGTAKVSPHAREGIPHHLVDLAEPEDVFTAGDYRRRAIEVLNELRRRGKIPILTAGTGLYLRALLEGLADAPARSEELRARLRERAETRGAQYLHRLLRRLDPESASRIAPRDAQKLIRAVEIRVLARKPIAEVYGAGREPLEGWHAVKIGLLPPRDALYARINERVEAMIAAGWLNEACALAASGSSRRAKPFQFIGYSDLLEVIEGRATIDAAIKHIQQATRQFAKRQITWFRREPGIHWLSGFGDDPAIAAAALKLLNS